MPTFSQSSATNGLTSSIAMTPLQGMELVNPDLMNRKIKDISKDNYFSAKSGFSTVIQNKKSGNGGAGGPTNYSNMIL